MSDIWYKIVNSEIVVLKENPKKIEKYILETMRIVTALNQFVSIYENKYFKTGWTGVHVSEMTHVTMPDRIHSIQFFFIKYLESIGYNRINSDTSVFSRLKLRTSNKYSFFFEQGTTLKYIRYINGLHHLVI